MQKVNENVENSYLLNMDSTQVACALADERGGYLAGSVAHIGKNNFLEQKKKR